MEKSKEATLVETGIYGRKEPMLMVDQVFTPTQYFPTNNNG